MTQEILGRYELASLLGRGGMAEVWSAHDKRRDRPVAVKVLTPRGYRGEALTTLEQRFLREVRFTARLRHPGIPLVHESGKLDDGRLYLVMEVVAGRTVSALAKDWGQWPVPLAASLAAQTADVLAHAHANGVVHRDLKPSNLMLTPENAVKVLDFGIAATLDPGLEEPRLTRTDAIPGTAGFMAPEQAEGRPVAGSDLYALGCILYELVAGTPPFEAENNLMLVYRHMTEAPLPVTSLRPDLPQGFADLVMQLLAKDPACRPASAGAVQDVVREWAGVGVKAWADAGHRVAIPGAPGLQARQPERVAAGGPAGSVGPVAAVARSGTPLHEGGRQAEGTGSVSTKLELYENLRQSDRPGSAHDGFVTLAAELCRNRPATDRELLACRIGIARCLAALGRAAEARHELEALLPVQQQAFGHADRTVFDTRYELAVLSAQVGDRDSARQQLVWLGRDQRAALPYSDESHARVDQLLARLDRMLPRQILR
ncbi:serine/threonine-protein kinase [Kitasatospora sp. NPDC007106]|uniref:serine/threonine-protein kinase n=1 Tax=Kitasatospora sp. NPDC007106 TaxID=3156914 RepID=UPI0033FA1A14